MDLAVKSIWYSVKSRMKPRVWETLYMSTDRSVLIKYGDLITWRTDPTATVAPGVRRALLMIKGEPSPIIVREENGCYFVLAGLLRVKRMIANGQADELVTVIVIGS